MDAGRPLWLFTGASTLQSLVAFYSGYAQATGNNNLPDRFEGFFTWLRDVKRELSGNWTENWLKGFVDDHHQAVMYFLHFVAEYAAANPPLDAAKAKPAKRGTVRRKPARRRRRTE